MIIIQTHSEIEVKVLYHHMIQIHLSIRKLVLIMYNFLFLLRPRKLS